MLETASKTPPSRIVDLSHEQANPPAFTPPHHKLGWDRMLHRNAVFCRAPRTIDGIVVHQTGTPFGVTAAAVKAAGGDKLLAKHRRALGIAAHMTAFDTGYAVLGSPLDWYVYHGNALNARSLGIEIEGLYPGDWGTQELFQGPIEVAARAGLAYLVSEGRRLGMPLRYVWAHRQSSLTRDDDPGEEIWRKLVMGYAVPQLGLEPQFDFVNGGHTIPERWRVTKVRVLA